MPVLAPTLTETGLAITDHLHDQLFTPESGEGRGLIGDALIGRIESVDTLAVADLPELYEGTRMIAKNAIEAAIKMDAAHEVHRQFYYQVFGIEEPIYSPVDDPFQLPPSAWPDAPELPLFTAA